MSQRHNMKFGDMMAKYLRKIYNNVAVEPILEDVTDVELLPLSTNQSINARVNDSVGGFCVAAVKKHVLSLRFSTH